MSATTSPSAHWTEESALADILDISDDSIQELTEAIAWTNTCILTPLPGLATKFSTLLTASEQCPDIVVKDHKTLRLINWVNSLANGTEWSIQVGDPKVPSELIHLIRDTRQKYFPL